MSAPNDMGVMDGMTTPYKTAVSGSAADQKIMTMVGVVLGVLWLIAGLTVMLGLVSPETIDAYRLGSGKGTKWIQLMLYPFVNYSAASLLFNLVWLSGLVRVARRHLTPAGFIRIYSLGTIGVGLIYWLLSKYLMGGQKFLSGSYLALFTIYGTVAAMGSNETLTPQPYAILKHPFLFAYVGCVFIDSLLLSQGSAMPFFNPTDGPGSLAQTVIMLNRQIGLPPILAFVHLVPTALLLYLMADVRLQWWVVLLLLSDLWLVLWLKLVGMLFPEVSIAASFFLVFILAEVVALAVGLLYGWAEKLYARPTRA
jgi:hypothetical protein